MWCVECVWAQYVVCVSSVAVCGCVQVGKREKDKPALNTFISGTAHANFITMAAHRARNDSREKKNFLWTKKDYDKENESSLNAKVKFNNILGIMYL